MAGDWIKIECVTPSKPEIFAIAEELGIDPDAVLGKVIRVWIWADQQTITGNAPSVTQAVIDRVAGLIGLGQALAKVGWLVVEKDGVSFPNFDRHNGNTAKTRALTQRRVQRKRNADSVTEAFPEKRREYPYSPQGDGCAVGFAIEERTRTSRRIGRVRRILGGISKARRRISRGQSVARTCPVA